MPFKNPLEQAESLVTKEEENPNQTPEEKKEKSEKDWATVVKELIGDEEEAIEGYNGAIAFINENADKIPEDKKSEYLNVLEEIKKDEEDHIAKLKALSGEEKPQESEPEQPKEEPESESEEKKEEDKE